MGIGDPYHKHPLKLVAYPHGSDSSGDCFHCELPIDEYLCYGCKDCKYYIHMSCHNLPIALRHPVHVEHHLTLFEPPNSFSSSNSSNFICNECQNPCLGRFAYQCTICQLFFHLKCLFTFKFEHHCHPLVLDKNIFGLRDCKICGTDILRSSFGCQSCEYYIHQECSLIPLEVKRHHVHELTLRHNFPEECDQVYCDLCEDRDGEMDRELSYYYCRRCDYIAHVNCCITQPVEDALLWERFTHEHPLRYNYKQTERLLCCSQCSYVVSEYTTEYPPSVKHPRHPHHTLVVDSGKDNGFNCTECHFSMDKNEFVKFTHPLWRYNLEFKCENGLFRCDACGVLGKGYRVGYKEDKFDLHLECFALPGKLEHESHPNHPLYLRWLQTSTPQYCIVCTKEMDPQLWFYYCQKCDYAAHVDCVAHDLVSALRSSIKNQVDFCSIIEPDKSLFKYKNADMRPPLEPRLSYSKYLPRLEVHSDTDDDEGNCDLGIETGGHSSIPETGGHSSINVLACPKCRSLIPTQATYSSFKAWKSGFLKHGMPTADEKIFSESEQLSFLDEQIIDELCCSICNMLIFPPTYSCASCQIYFHKSCAQLPRKILFNETTYVLMAPPFPEGLSNCTSCGVPISSWAYVSSGGEFIFDVICACGGPLVNRTYYNQDILFLLSGYDFECKACKNDVNMDTFMMTSEDTKFYIHPECGLLPAVIKHRIHQHPLELATDLAKLDCEYFCDVCEKDLNPDLWAYRCMDICGIWATSHVSCVITSKKKCHFSYNLECQKWTEEQQLEFRKNAKKLGINL